MNAFPRRRLLAGAAGIAAGAATAGCGAGGLLGTRRQVRVAVSWSAAELQAFNAVLHGLGPLPYHVRVLPLGDDIAAALGPASSPRPDVVMMPQPGTVLANADRLAPLPASITEWPYAPVWEVLRRGRARPIGVPFKMAHESTVWYRRSVLDRLGLAAPQTWAQWRNVNAELVRAGVPPLAVAAADGWMLTQNFDNVLLRAAPGAHQRLVGGTLSWSDEGVQRAFRLLGRMWAAPGALAGGVNGSLVQQFPDAVVEVFGHRRAAMVVAPDFAEGVIRRFAADPEDVATFDFPTLAGGDGEESVPPPQQPEPLVVGGDIAVLTAPASEHAEDLVRRLAEPGASLPWIRDYGGFLAPDWNTDPLVYSPALRRLAERIGERGRELVFDLSDDLGALGGREGLWRVLQDFLVRVARGGPQEVPDAARDAAGAMAGLAGQGR